MLEEDPALSAKARTLPRSKKLAMIVSAPIVANLSHRKRSFLLRALATRFGSPSYKLFLSRHGGDVLHEIWIGGARK